MKNANANSWTVGVMVPVPGNKKLNIEQKEAINKITEYLEKTESITFRLEQNKKELYDKYIQAYGKEEKEEPGRGE